MPKKKEKPLVRKIRGEHGYPVLYLGKDFVGLLGREVVIDPHSMKENPTNPLAWKIILKPLPNQRVESASQSQSKKQPRQMQAQTGDQDGSYSTSATKDPEHHDQWSDISIPNIHGYC